MLSPHHHEWDLSEHFRARSQDGSNSEHGPSTSPQTAYSFLDKLPRQFITLKGGNSSGPGEGFDVAKTGDAQLGLWVSHLWGSQLC